MSEFPDRPAPPQPLLHRAQSWARWFGLGRLFASAVVVIAVVIGAYWLVKPPVATTESKLPYANAAAPPASSVASAAATAPTSSVATADLVVHVAGAVQSPGVYRIAAGSRVVDALQAAGGVVADSNANAINLAAPLVDGERVYVPRIGEIPPVVVASASGTGGPAVAPTGPVNLNTASADDLDTLPGVGPSTAEAILAYRDQHGPFASVDDLSNVRGIGPAKLDALRGLVTV